jgi:hypothetical protein
MNNCVARKAATDAVVAIFRQGALDSEASREAEMKAKKKEGENMTGLEDEEGELENKTVKSADKEVELDDEKTELSGDKLEGG